MNLCKVGNQTSSQDPQAVNSRIFVGNLNTFQVNKIDVERLFQRYGRIVGISMHKGYAFVQFANPFDARCACLGEDGKTVSGQTLDVNMVSEPKAHQIQKTKPEDSEQNGIEQTARKRPKEEDVSCRTPVDLNALKTYGLPDILICGNCKEMFNSLNEIIYHKRNYCKLRFACKCNGSHCHMNTAEDLIYCQTCEAPFRDPMSLLQHIQSSHNIKLFETIRV